MVSPLYGCMDVSNELISETALMIFLKFGMTVLVNGEKSQPAPVISGVPQGSVICPLLFLILISDIEECIYNSFVSSFADDTRVGCGIASAEDAANLQEDLKRIYSWAITNNMLFTAKSLSSLDTVVTLY